ncbi:hypothetical protein BT93_C0700 [Corymbia citriodora subsp. variegata]|nr:hypothetical protein BT93_C0700 [Corymbia citriodora subsp. variegata]
MTQKAITASQTAALTSLARKCTTLSQLKQLHAHILKVHLPEKNPSAIGPLLSVAATSGDPSFFSYACSIFEHLRCRNTFMYNTMIRGYVQSGSPVAAVSLYLAMLSSGVEGNNYTFPPLIKACIVMGPDSKSIGLLVHAHVVKFGYHVDPFVVSALIEFYSSVCDLENARKLFDRTTERDVVTWTALVDGYGKAGDLENARLLFDEMPKRNVISWSAMMAAYSRVSDFKEVLSLFRQMQEVGFEPNESVLVSVLTACAHLGAVTQGLWVHSYAKRVNFISNRILATALVDMYSRCGLVDLALSVFHNISDKDAEAWNAMIAGVALNGDAEKSLELFKKMIARGTQPTETTFVALLTAYTHAKMTKEGLKLFKEINNVHGVQPKSEHFACIVDLLARSGMVEEAEKFMEEKIGGLGGADANVWGALLHACRVYGNVELGNRIWKKLTDMGITDSGTHVLSYNIYKQAGWENQANHLRKLISDARMKKLPGCSVIEVNGAVKEFRAGDFCHPQALEMCRLLDSFLRMVNLEEFYFS